MAATSRTVVPLCPICQGPMKAERSTKRFFGLPEHKQYECQRCAVIASVAEAREESTYR
jgi:hypothetical protein